MNKYEMHLHTMETSRCGHVRAVDQVRAYHKLGYQGICVTDHLHNTYIELMDCHDDWHECIRRYLYGYQLAKAEGQRLGMDVIFAVELRFPENESDYLIYGIDEQWRPTAIPVTRIGTSSLWPWRRRIPTLSAPWAPTPIGSGTRAARPC